MYNTAETLSMKKKNKGTVVPTNAAGNFPGLLHTARQPDSHFQVVQMTHCPESGFRTRYVGHSRSRSKNHVHSTNKAFTVILIWTMTIKTHHHISHKASEKAVPKMVNKFSLTLIHFILLLSHSIIS